MAKKTSEPPLGVKTRPRKRGEDRVAVTAYLSIPVYRRLRERAYLDARQFSGMIEKAIVEFLDRLEGNER